MQYQPNELLTVARVCREYGVGKTTIYEVLASGALAAKKIGKRGTRIRRCDMDAWVASLAAYVSSCPQTSSIATTEETHMTHRNSVVRSPR